MSFDPSLAYVAYRLLQTLKEAEASKEELLARFGNNLPREAELELKKISVTIRTIEEHLHTLPNL